MPLRVGFWDLKALYLVTNVALRLHQPWVGIAALLLAESIFFLRGKQMTIPASNGHLEGST